MTLFNNQKTGYRRGKARRYFVRSLAVAGLFLAGLMCPGLTASAQVSDTVKTGVFAEGIELSGMNRTEVTAAIEVYVEELGELPITLLAADDNQVPVTAAELGIEWANREIVDEALELGTKGNVIERYKVLKDLQQEPYVFPVEIAFDIDAINTILTEKCAKYDCPAIDYSLKRENGQFVTVPGQIGYFLDVETSIDKINDYLILEWDRTPCEIALDIAVEQPKGSEEELAEVRDVLGTYTTHYTTSGASRCANVENACRLINGMTLYPGEEFSALDTITPFSQANGYYMAGSYLNGKVVDSLGGGVCQVTTTLYNAMLLAELETTERHAHSMIVSYVNASADAAIAESAGKNFRFVNSTDYPIYIEGHTENKAITFTIYGKETRDLANRKVRYESEILETINPTQELIYQDAGQPIGYVVTDSAHVGYKAKLWKIVTENGVEVSRTEVNSSSYKMTPRSLTVGTATGDPNAYNTLMEAIATGSIDHVKNTVSMLTTPIQNTTEVGDQ